MDCDTARRLCADLLKRPQHLRQNSTNSHCCSQANGVFEFLCIIEFGATCHIKSEPRPHSRNSVDIEEVFMPARTAAMPFLSAESGLAHYLDGIRRSPMLEPEQEY